MEEHTEVADHVAIEVAGKVAGIPARTLRHWVASGKLAAIAGKRGKLVSMGEVARLAAVVGKPVGNVASPVGNPATFADTIAGNVAESVAESALVSDAARQQLATIRDEWLAPLVARIGELERENGRLEAERDALRQRAEAAEAAASTLRAQRGVQEAPTAHEVAPQQETPNAAQRGLRAALGRWWRGEG